jgi:hypothetical protein
MPNLEEHVREAHNSLEAAQTSLEAAQHAFERSGNEANAHFLRDAQEAYDEARAMYDGARNAQDTTVDR